MRYYFNIVRRGQHLRDFEGGEFENDLEAKTEARHVAREIVGRELIAGKDIEWTSVVEVLRADNVVVAVLDFIEALDLPLTD